MHSYVERKGVILDSSSFVFICSVPIEEETKKTKKEKSVQNGKVNNRVCPICLSFRSLQKKYYKTTIYLYSLEKKLKWKCFLKRSR